MRVDSLTAIDVHVHIESDGHGCFSLDDELMAASARYFKSGEDRAPALDRVAGIYRSLNMAAVVFTVDAATFTGHPALSSEDICEQAREHADVLIPFGSVDPLRGADAVAQARRLVTEHGARGFKFHPSLQGFAPNDERFYPLWEEISHWASRPSSTPGRPASARGCPAAGGSSCGCRTRCSSTMSRPTSRG
jgi:predicted TIM-barrel fold metal-dependent hydrolase